MDSTPPRPTPYYSHFSHPPSPPQASSRSPPHQVPSPSALSPLEGGSVPPDVRRLQSEMVRMQGHHASDVVQELIRVPDVIVTDSSDVHELRSRIHELRAMLKAFAATAEQACHEVERRWKTDMEEAAAKPAAPSPGSPFSLHGRVDSTVQMPPRPPSTIFPKVVPGPSITPLIDAILDLISATQEEEGWDLLRDHEDEAVRQRQTHTTVGIRMAMRSNARDLRPCQIQLIIPGTSAHLCNQLSRGDEITAVDGMRVDHTNIVAAVRGSDIVGSLVTLQVRKGGHPEGKLFNVMLVRGAWGAVERKEKLFICFEELAKALEDLFGLEISDGKGPDETVVHSRLRASPRRGSQPPAGSSSPPVPFMGHGGEDIVQLLLRCISQARENEKHRTMSDMRIHDRLQGLQREMRQLLALVKERALHQESELALAHRTLLEHTSQISIPLHEQVEDYVVQLQQQLADAEEAKEEAFTAIGEVEAARVETEQKGEVLNDWMKTIKRMHKLAAFSKRKLTKAYAVSKAQGAGGGGARPGSVAALSDLVGQRARNAPPRAPLAGGGAFAAPRRGEV